MFWTKFCGIRTLSKMIIRPNTIFNSVHKRSELQSLLPASNVMQLKSRMFMHFLKSTKATNGIESSTGIFLQPKSINHTLNSPDKSTFLSAEIVSVAQHRCTGSFFQKSGSSTTLWKSATGVSSQGRKRGRAKGLLRIKNLNRGQKLGFGRERIRFPGLSAHATNRAKEKHEIGRIDEEEHKNYVDGLKELQAKSLGTKRKRRQTPLERGWTGSSPQGRKFGQPISTNPEMKFENFESILISYRNQVSMTGVFGRVRSLKLIMVTGNKNGTAGFASTQAAFG